MDQDDLLLLVCDVNDFVRGRTQNINQIVAVLAYSLGMAEAANSLCGSQREDVDALVSDNRKSGQETLLSLAIDGEHAPVSLLGDERS